MEKIYFALLLLGAACFLFAAVSARRPEPWPTHALFLLPLGLLLWVLVPLLQTARHM